ncbi:MAG TPA: hypothetical protein VGA65_01770 [Hyphomicrobium sp.]|jgi:hypothetical protein
MKTKAVAAIALSICVMTIDQAVAGFFHFTPNPTPPPTPPPAVPEFDGLGAVAAIALLVSVVAIIYQRARKLSGEGSSE